MHRALLGSLERIFGILLDHYGGAIPVWLIPVQAILIPIADRHVPYAESVAQQSRDAGLRVDVDDSSDRMRAKIRNAQMQKIPYMLIVGDKEMEEGQVNLRRRDGTIPGAMTAEAFITMTKSAVQDKALL